MLESGIRDPDEEVVAITKNVFFPVLGLWAVEINKLRSVVLSSFIKECQRALEVSNSILLVFSLCYLKLNPFAKFYLDILS